MEVILYSTGCPKCNVLKKKLLEKDIDYSEYTSVDGMVAMGINEVPILSVDGQMMSFAEAVNWMRGR